MEIKLDKVKAIMTEKKIIIFLKLEKIHEICLEAVKFKIVALKKEKFPKQTLDYKVYQALKAWALIRH